MNNEEDHARDARESAPAFFGIKGIKFGERQRVRKGNLGKLKGDRMLRPVRSSFTGIPSPDERFHKSAATQRPQVDLTADLAVENAMGQEQRKISSAARPLTQKEH